ncbi:ABC-F family ATP-binding cassette domain-containing protein [Veillonella sp. VA142]|uniref:ABC-F family ATP-binding cassette domain-containing protein n=1 Tax=Veillonella sp. VA142 TaxID=741834 RepID=UPI000F8E941D|nr:ABC-F family ATP-binding cassette domain-containing protein [Veillonella sp. VA142]
MNILTLQQVEKSYGTRLLFKDVNLTIESHHRIGLIGVNGTGKTTLLQVLEGIQEPDKGSIERNGKATIHRLEQDPYIDERGTLLDNVLLGDHPKLSLVRDFERALQNPESPQYMKLLARMDEEDGWTVEQEAKMILTRLGFHDVQGAVKNLSGGQRRRLALARALVYPCDLLLLDEPTNHLDEATIEWLELYLKERKGAVLLSTHDRYFLDAVCNTIWELSNQRIYEYQETYETYVSLKAEREAQLDAIEEKRRKLIASELQWVRRGAKARTTKQKARLQRFEQLKAMEERQKTGTVDPVVLATRLGNTIFDIEDMSFSYDSGHEVISDFTYHMVRHDRIGVVGPNGIGKTTLMKLFQGSIEPTKGTMGRGETVRIGYFSQMLPHFKEDQRVLDYIRENRSYLHLPDGSSLSAGQLLERFLFPPSHHGLPIRKLSGGEKRRLFLLRILMDAPNVLLLDEPTNDLDIPTLEVLEDFLDSYSGIVITVCHDRYFLDRVVDKLFVFTGSGHIEVYHGGYSDYVEDTKTTGSMGGDTKRGVLRHAVQVNSSMAHGVQANSALSNAEQNVGTNTAFSERNQAYTNASSIGTMAETDSDTHGSIKHEKTMVSIREAGLEGKKKLTLGEMKELEQLELRIAELEGLLKAYDAMIAQGGSDYSAIESTVKEQEQVAEELEVSTLRWMELEERK